MAEYKSYLRPAGRGIKLHLGCGDWWFDGYINIDMNIYGGVDMLYDLRQRLPFQDEVVEIIEAHDYVEHISYREIEPMLDDWHRVLIKGGKVVVTLPEFDALTKQYVEATGEERETAKMHIYGIESDHRWGYTLESGKALFERHNFQDVDSHMIDTGKDSCPRMEIIAWKK
jgi:predicted SAM-dependent methyltransferase